MVEAVRVAELVTYDFDDIENPQKTLPRAVLSAIVVYVIVALGVTTLVGADQVVASQEVALSSSATREPNLSTPL